MALEISIIIFHKYRKKEYDFTKPFKIFIMFNVENLNHHPTVHRDSSSRSKYDDSPIEDHLNPLRDSPLKNLSGLRWQSG
jgi:hypothetical protein